MITHKKNGEYTKQFINFMQRKYEQYLESEIDSIYLAYTKPSNAKINAWQEILKDARFQPYILTYNCQRFTVAYYQYSNDDLFVVDTGINKYEILSKYLKTPNKYVWY